MFLYKSFTSLVKIGVELLFLCWVKERGIVWVLLKVLLKASNTYKIVTQTGIKYVPQI